MHGQYPRHGEEQPAHDTLHRNGSDHSDQDADHLRYKVLQHVHSADHLVGKALAFQDSQVYIIYVHLGADVMPGYDQEDDKQQNSEARYHRQDDLDKHARIMLRALAVCICPRKIRNLGLQVQFAKRDEHGVIRLVREKYVDHFTR